MPRSAAPSPSSNTTSAGTNNLPSAVVLSEEIAPLLRSGIDRNSLKIGTEIVVRGYQSKDKACTPVCKANGRDVTFPDGRKLFMGSSGTGAPKDGADPGEMPK